MEYTEHTSNKEYASKGVAGTALGLSIGALGLQVLGSGIGGLVTRNISSDNNQVYTKDLAEKDSEIAALRAQQIVDTKLVDVYKELRTQDKNQDAVISNLKDRVTAIEVSAPLREQIVLGQVQNVANSVTSVNNDLSNRIGYVNTNLQGQICQINQTLNNITKTVIPNSSVCPGWGNITISPTTAAAA